jgi:hypothetical protein
MRSTSLAALVAGLLLTFGSAEARVDVHVAIPAPPSIVIDAPPHVVVVPGVPAVQYAPDLGYDYFVYGGRYYTYHSGAWFASSSYGGPWTYVRNVPRPIVGLPRHYYRHYAPVRHARYRHLPPGHARKVYSHHRHHYRHHRHHDHH